MRLSEGKLQRHYTKVEGLSIHDRRSTEALPEDAPIVILVHGLVVSSRYMMPTAELLAPVAHVYAPDLPGYGESDKPDYMLELPELADILCKWMDAVGIEKATMLGNSFGCQIIVEFAIRHPHRLERAVLQGPTMNRHTRTFGQQLWQLILDSRYEDSSQAPIQAYDYWQAGLLRAVCTIQIALADRIEAKLPDVQVPTLVVRGEKDPLVPSYWAEEVVELLPQGQLAVIPGGGHTLNYSAPLELTRVTKAFLEATKSHPLKQEV